LFSKQDRKDAPVSKFKKTRPASSNDSRNRQLLINVMLSESLPSKPRPVPVRARPTTVSQPEGQEGIVKGVVESRDIEMMDVELAVDGELD
jgi:hypothetical protein